MTERDVHRASAASCEVSCETHSLVQGKVCTLEVDGTRERNAAEEGEGLDLVHVAPNMEAGGSHLQASAKEVREIRRMVEFLVRRERKLDVKADVAVRRLERQEKEHSQLEDEAHEASLPDARQYQSREARRRQRLRLWQSPFRRSRLHSCQRCPWCRSPCYRHWRVGAGYARRSASLREVPSVQSLGTRRVERGAGTRRGRAERRNKSGEQRR